MKKEKTKYLGVDIGGTWIKGAMVDERYFETVHVRQTGHFQVKKVKSPLNAFAKLPELARALEYLIRLFNFQPAELSGIGISTPGIINYHGTEILKAAAHLNILKNNSWKETLEKQLKCSISVINDADAAAIGLAETGSLTGNKTTGIMPVGTGLGFSVWRNGRRWRPGKSFTLLGSIRIPDGTFDSVASASKLAEMDENDDLTNVLTNSTFQFERAAYIRNLGKVITTAAILYKLDDVILCGGLVDAASACGYPLEKELKELLSETPVELDKPVDVVVAKQGNRLQLMGTLALAKGESEAVKMKIIPGYHSLETEIPYKKDLPLQTMQNASLIETFWQAEQEAGERLRSSLPLIADIADQSVPKIMAGGRIIYAGAGTSGRIAAMDAVEIPCTYGFPEDRILTLIAGGVSDAAIEIESEFEEDASAVPEMLLLNIQPEDVVIGVSASGAAYYVQSALAFAKSRKAMSVFIQAARPATELPFCDHVISLHSGNEVVAGSTRMKAGTATKKALNFLSSSIMIKLGKVEGPYMIDVACVNNKLVERAQNILKILYNINEEDSFEKLKSANMSLRKTIDGLRSNLTE